MTLKKATKRLEEEYEKAKKLEWVHNPISYALFQVWKEADGSGVRKDKEREENGEKKSGN